MSGIASLFGGNSAKTDRKQQLDSRDSLRNIFYWGLPTAQGEESKGAGSLDQAGSYFGNLLRAGRTETTQNAAPALNANLSAADATKRREAITGTGRTGGTAEADRFAAADTQANEANIVNQTMQADKDKASTGLVNVGSDRLKQALGLLGLSDTAQAQVLNDTNTSRKTSQELHDNSYDRVGGDIGQLVASFL